jgi:hypothetical protein
VVGASARPAALAALLHDATGSWLPVLQHLPSVLQTHESTLGKLGVLILVVAWFGLRRLSVGKAVSVRAVLVVAFVWMVPLLLVPPFQSDDAFVYVANGRLVDVVSTPGTQSPRNWG